MMRRMPTITRSDWHLTHHARERMLDRGISALDLDRLVRQPQRVIEDMKKAYGSLHYYSGYGLLALVNVARREIVTVGHDGASSADWQQHCRNAAGRYLPGAPVLELDAITADLDAAERRHRQPEQRRQRRQESRTRTSAVATRNVLDDVAPALRPSILRQCGGDLRRLTILSPTRVLVA